MKDDGVDVVVSSYSTVMMFALESSFLSNLKLNLNPEPLYGTSL
jgi:hypothetical protein